MKGFTEASAKSSSVENGRWMKIWYVYFYELLFVDGDFFTAADEIYQYFRTTGLEQNSKACGEPK